MLDHPSDIKVLTKRVSDVIIVIICLILRIAQEKYKSHYKNTVLSIFVRRRLFICSHTKIMKSSPRFYASVSFPYFVAVKKKRSKNK